MDLDKLGLSSETSALAETCLKFGPPSHLFWNEEGGGASVLLPPALETFPYEPQKCLNMITSLADANKESAEKVRFQLFYSNI